MSSNTQIKTSWGLSNEFSHSAMIVEFFWFFVSVLTLAVAIIKLIKINSVHEITDYQEEPKPKPQLPVNDPQRVSAQNAKAFSKSKKMKFFKQSVLATKRNKHLRENFAKIK